MIVFLGEILFSLISNRFAAVGLPQSLLAIAIFLELYGVRDSPITKESCSEAAWRIADRPALVEATIDNDADVSPPDDYLSSLKGD